MKYKINYEMQFEMNFAFTFHSSWKGDKAWESRQDLWNMIEKKVLQ